MVNQTAREKSATLPHCYFCSRPTDESDWCYGCHQFICEACWQEREEPETRTHNPEDHQLAKEDK